MSNYTKSTNFATKDNLTPGDPLKIVRGTEIDTEYNNIATAIATKTDNASAAITGGTINDTTIGTTTASTGAFTTLAASGAITSTLATGTAPLVVASTTKVANLNVDSLDGADWASPAALGSTTPAAVSATTLSASGNVTISGGTANGVAYLNGSKVVTSGSAFTFDGTNLATTGDISLGAGKLLKYSSTAYMTPENNVSGAEISTTGVILFKAGSGTPEQMRLTSTGLGIGTSSPSTKFQVTYSGASNFNVGSAFAKVENLAGATAILYLTDTTDSTSIRNIGSSLAFYNSSTEGMRLDSSGNLLVGTTSSTGERIQVIGTSGAGTMSVQVGANGNNGIGFRNASGTSAGSITVNASTVAYNTSSDYRLKNTIAPMTGALAKVAVLKPVTYKWNADGSDGEGFIAHELAEVCPDAVTGEKDGTRIEKYEISPAVAATYDEDGNELTPGIEAVIGEREVPQYQGIDTSFLVATLTAAIQEAHGLIKSLEARVVALEAK